MNTNVIILTVKDIYGDKETLLIDDTADNRQLLDDFESDIEDFYDKNNPQESDTYEILDKFVAQTGATILNAKLKEMGI